jgi:hypothetical protein
VLWPAANGRSHAMLGLPFDTLALWEKFRRLDESEN